MDTGVDGVSEGVVTEEYILNLFYDTQHFLVPHCKIFFTFSFLIFDYF